MLSQPVRRDGRRDDVRLPRRFTRGSRPRWRSECECRPVRRRADESARRVTSARSCRHAEARRTEPVDMVSVVAGPASRLHARRGRRGIQRAASTGAAEAVCQCGSTIRERHRISTACEQIANEQIDAGSDVVFVDAGRCGLGALAVATASGGFGESADTTDGCGAGRPHVLRNVLQGLRPRDQCDSLDGLRARCAPSWS